MPTLYLELSEAIRFQIDDAVWENVYYEIVKLKQFPVNTPTSYDFDDRFRRIDATIQNHCWNDYEYN